MIPGSDVAHARLPVCVVMPAWNAAAGIHSALRPVVGLVRGVIVADGGSADATVAMASDLGAAVVQGPRGRGPQLHAGAEAAMKHPDCAWLLFLHADTRLQPGWEEAVRAHIAASGSEMRAGHFHFRLDDPAPAARRLERIVAWRCRLLALPYGDQGLLIHRALYKELGGYRSIPLMEDVDMIRRIGRARLCRLAADALTSATRYRHGGYWRRPARNLSLLALYFLGVSPERLVRWYG